MAKQELKTLGIKKTFLKTFNYSGSVLAMKSWFLIGRNDFRHLKVFGKQHAEVRQSTD